MNGFGTLLSCVVLMALPGYVPVNAHNNVPPPAQQGAVVLTGATVHTVDGETFDHSS